MAPDMVLKMLSEYFTMMAALIESLNGTLLEFIGDAILAVWNAPNPCVTHSTNAVEVRALRAAR